uniref:Putative secreted protein n=1 Tax=Anopheles marajoara TaxID=58244 RepID=A0A2M4C5N6_9DIPT
MAAHLLLHLLHQRRLLALLSLVKANAGRRRFTMDDGKLGTDRFPGERQDRFLHLNRIDGNGLLAHVEDFKVVEHAQKLHIRVLLVLLILLRLRESIDLHAQIVTRLLPVDLAVGHVEQVLRAQLNLLRNGQQRHLRRYIHLFGNPVRDDVVRRRPVKVPDALDLDRFHVQQEERGRIVDVDLIVDQPGHVAVIV